MNHDTLLPFDLPAVARKKLTVDFAGGNQSSDGGLLLLREAERGLGICARLAGSIRDLRNASRVQHTLVELIKMRVLAICCGYEDGNDLDRLKDDPLLKMAVGRAPESGAALCSQSTISRLENMPSRTEAVRLTAALIDQFCASFATPPVEGSDDAIQYRGVGMHLRPAAILPILARDGSALSGEHLGITLNKGCKVFEGFSSGVDRVCHMLDPGKCSCQNAQRHREPGDYSIVSVCLCELLVEGRPAKSGLPGLHLAAPGYEEACWSPRRHGRSSSASRQNPPRFRGAD
jgi:Transposase DDE domain group 1